MNAPLRFWMLLGFALPLAPLASLANAESVQSEADEYTRYELLAPETASFKICRQGKRCGCA